jgi:glycosyltransferase involved in cell wall biosynthesis
VRILHISTRLILGGSQENTVLSCEGQARRPPNGHDVHLAFGPIYGPEGSLLDRVERFRTDDGRGIITHTVPHLVREVSPLADRKCLSELRALIRAVKPDIVHTHSSKAGVLGRFAAWAEGGKTNRIGVVHTIHGPPFMPVEGSTMRRAKITLTNAMYQMAEELAATRCHAIVSVADAMTAEFRRRGIGRDAQFITIRSGMEIQKFLRAAPGESRADIRAALGIAPDRFVIGTVARLAEHKGHDDILDALGADLLANPSWVLLWVGDGWWRTRLEARIGAMGLTDRVVRTGLVPPDRIPGLMRAMDVLVHPSAREGLPRTVPQALLSGAAVVAYDADGTREACIDRITGRLVPVGDLAGLREAVVWMTDPAHRAATVLAGRTMCAELFDADRMVEALDHVYDRARAGLAPHPE